MKYIIECRLYGGKWCRSGRYPLTYEQDVAESILDDESIGGGEYRMVPVPKPYRHSAVTPLELRGALAMLKSARLFVGLYEPAASMILANAVAQVRAELEAL
jgi:hypothetical protein